MPGRCKLLIFDLDGTLIDSFADIRQSLQAAFATLGVELGESVLSLVHRGVGLEVFYEEATGSPVTADPARFEGVVAAYRSHYADNSANRPFEHAEELLLELRAKRPEMRLAVATAKRTVMATRVLAHCELARFFDVVRGTDELPHKPDPALLHEVCRLAGRPVSDAVMVGDTDKDVQAAQAAGVTSVGIAHGGLGRAALESLGPDHVVDDLDDLRRLLFES